MNLTPIPIESEILITQSILYFIAAAIPIYLTFIAKAKMSNDNNHFKRLLVVLASFVLMQGIYHVVNLFGYKILAKGILEPISFGILIFFGVFYFINKTRSRSEELIVT